MTRSEFWVQVVIMLDLLTMLEFHQPSMDSALIGRNIQKSKVDILPTILGLKRFICMKI